MATKILPDRKAKSKPKPKPKPIPKTVFNRRVKVEPEVLVRYKGAARKQKRNLSAKAKHSSEQKSDKSVAKEKNVPEPTNISVVYWNPSPSRQDNDYNTDVSWFGLGTSRFDYSIRTLLDDGKSWELSNKCQLDHNKSNGFSVWYKTNSTKRQQMLAVDDFVYDKSDKKYYTVETLPTEDQLYVWHGYDNYFVGYAFELDPYKRIIREGDGKINTKWYMLYSEEIVIVKEQDLEYFYFKQNAQNDLYQSLDDGIFRKMAKNGKARKLPFYEKVMGNSWQHYIKEQLDNNDIEYKSNGCEATWTFSSFEQADQTFPKEKGSYFERLWGNKRHFVEDMDFILYKKKNKLRIYSVIMNQDIKTKHVNGRTINKRSK